MDKIQAEIHLKAIYYLYSVFAWIESDESKNCPFCGKSLIFYRLDTMEIKSLNKLPIRANIVMDTAYFGILFGLMIFIDNASKFVLYRCIIHYETNVLYLLGIEHIKSQGIDIKSITCDISQGFNSLFCRRSNPI